MQRETVLSTLSDAFTNNTKAVSNTSVKVLGTFENVATIGHVKSALAVAQELHEAEVQLRQMAIDHAADKILLDNALVEANIKPEQLDAKYTLQSLGY